MRIALLSTGHPTADRYPEGGGTQYEIQGIAEGLAGRGHDVHVIARSIGFTEFAPGGVRYHQITPKRNDEVLSVIDFGRMAVSHIKEIRPDIMYVSQRFSAMFPSRLPLPKVFAFHNSDGVRSYWRFALWNNPINLFVFPFKNQLEEHIMRACQRVIVPAKSWLLYLRDHKIPQGVVISHGLRMDDYQNRGDEGFILYAGRLSYVKGVDILLKAFAMAKNGGRPDLVLAGDGPDSAECHTLARKLGIAGRVKFLGQVKREKLLELYATCSAVVLPSRFETFGLTASEGLASGKAVIASNIPGPTDYIEDGENGILFSSENIIDLKESLQMVFDDEDLRARLGVEARKRAEEAFSFESVALQHEDLYETVLQEGGPGP